MIAPAGQAMVDVVMDQRALCLGHRTLDGVQLRCEVKACPPLINHADDAVQMPLGTLQPRGYGRVACVGEILWYIVMLSPPGGLGKHRTGAFISEGHEYQHLNHGNALPETLQQLARDGERVTLINC
jgi:hypothetical protein